MKLLMLVAFLGLAAPQDHQTEKAAPAPVAIDANQAVIAAQLPSYPLTTCAVSGEELGGMGEPIDHVVEGRLVRLCCKGCVKKVDADPAAFLAKVDEAVIRAQKPTYPLTTCPVSGEELGEGAVDVVVGTRLVRTCCKRCAEGVAKNSAKHMPVVDKAYMDAQRATYPSKTCLVSGEELGEDAVEVLYGTRLVRLCCKGCVKGFQKEPAKVLAQLDEAAKRK